MKKRRIRVRIYDCEENTSWEDQITWAEFEVDSDTNALDIVPLVLYNLKKSGAVKKTPDVPTTVRLT